MPCAATSPGPACALHRNTSSTSSLPHLPVATRSILVCVLKLAVATAPLFLVNALTFLEVRACERHETSAAAGTPTWLPLSLPPCLPAGEAGRRGQRRRGGRGAAAHLCRQPHGAALLHGGRNAGGHRPRRRHPAVLPLFPGAPDARAVQHPGEAGPGRRAAGTPTGATPSAFPSATASCRPFCGQYMTSFRLASHKGVLMRILGNQAVRAEGWAQLQASREAARGAIKRGSVAHSSPFCAADVRHVCDSGPGRLWRPPAAVSDRPPRGCRCRQVCARARHAAEQPAPARLHVAAPRHGLLQRLSTRSCRCLGARPGRVARSLATHCMMYSHVMLLHCCAVTAAELSHTKGQRRARCSGCRRRALRAAAQRAVQTWVQCAASAAAFCTPWCGQHRRLNVQDCSRRAGASVRRRVAARADSSVAGHAYDLLAAALVSEHSGRPSGDGCRSARAGRPGRWPARRR